MTSPHLKKDGVHETRHPGSRGLPGGAQGPRQGQSPAPGARPAPSAQLRSPGPLAPPRPAPPRPDFWRWGPRPSPRRRPTGGLPVSPMMMYLKR